MCSEHAPLGGNEEITETRRKHHISLISGPIGEISPVRSFNSLTGSDFSPDRADAKELKVRQNDRKSRFKPPPPA